MYRIGTFALILTCAVTTMCLLYILRSSLDFVIVKTELGRIKGYKAEDGSYIKFFGIPYGRVNMSNVFGTAIPHEGFGNNVFDAYNVSTKCPQIVNNSSVGTVDCLQLDIFVPKDAGPKKRLPVMVWIHGGEFEIGSKGDFYGPKFLVRHSIILVRINYRIGPYGFMCLDIPEVPGNQGLKDQVLAFRWIKKHIAAFGGDVNRITAFGSNAGAHSIDFHIRSDSEILFNNAILQSGSSLSSNVFTERDKNAPITIARMLGFRTDSTLEALMFLSSADIGSVLRATDLIKMKFKPCQELPFENTEPFLTSPWINMKTPKVKNMSLIIGFCEHELLFRYIDQLDFNPLPIIRNQLIKMFNFDSERLNVTEELIRDFYFTDYVKRDDLIFSLTYFDSDFTYIHPIRRSIKKYLDGKVNNLFYYMFSYNGKRNLGKLLKNINIGSAIHGDDIGYLFEVDCIKEEMSLEDKSVVDRMTTMWANFATYSDPTPKITKVLPVKWMPITDGSFKYIGFNVTLISSQDPNKNRMDFWDSFYMENKQFEKP